MTVKRVFLLLIVAGCLHSAAHADTVYTSAAAFAAATTNPNVTTFGTTAYSGQYATVAAPGQTYTAGPVSFTPANVYLNLNNADYYALHGGSPAYPDGNWAGLVGGTTGVADVIRIAFPSSTAFSLNLGGYFAGTENFTYTLSDGFTGAFTSSAYVTSGKSLDFLGFTTSSPITFITISSSSDATFDNVTYAAAVTPEPSSLALLGTGIVGVIGAVRKRFA